MVPLQKSVTDLHQMSDDVRPTCCAVDGSGFHSGPLRLTSAAAHQDTSGCCVPSCPDDLTRHAHVTPCHAPEESRVAFAIRFTMLLTAAMLHFIR